MADPLTALEEKVGRSHPSRRQADPCARCPLMVPPRSERPHPRPRSPVVAASTQGFVHVRESVFGLGPLSQAVGGRGQAPRTRPMRSLASSHSLAITGRNWSRSRLTSATASFRSCLNLRSARPPRACRQAWCWGDSADHRPRRHRGRSPVAPAPTVVRPQNGSPGHSVLVSRPARRRLSSRGTRTRFVSGSGTNPSAAA